jgi:hypothetical protein
MKPAFMWIHHPVSDVCDLSTLKNRIRHLTNSGMLEKERLIPKEVSSKVEKLEVNGWCTQVTSFASVTTCVLLANEIRSFADGLFTEG